jgi:hypothetical protein
VTSIIAGFDFVLVDLDLGMTFMDVAETSRVAETTSRNQNNARRAYDAVLRLSEKLKLSPSQRQAIDAKLPVLKARLQSVGQQF